MAYKINLPLGKGWSIEQELIDENGEDVLAWYADNEENGCSIELYVGNTPEDSDAKEECINSYIEVIGVENEDEEIPVFDIPFLGATGWYYDAQDDEGSPVVMICVEPREGVFVMAIISHRSEEGLDELITYVDENLVVE